MRYRCYSPKCGKMPKGFEFEADAPICPKCGQIGQPGVQELIDVHFVAMHAQGPIMGAMGRQFVACQPTRDHTAAHEMDKFSATDDPRAVTCRSCMGTKEYQEMSALFPEIARAALIEKAMGMSVSGGCSGRK